ncbi:hypothetical protein Hypma_000559 [Hypsizygus marmoreus]|uniref:Uncharacterized protein n=1 Tax=Hypsizygus marmoreus TaxID=39966 RepID=A0A369JF12_HYPMA|nr:hypothetical protein Hypma_000559 [Hypsizygus marmoreus]
MDAFTSFDDISAFIEVTMNPQSTTAIDSFPIKDEERLPNTTAHAFCLSYRARYTHNFYLWRSSASLEANPNCIMLPPFSFLSLDFQPFARALSVSPSNAASTPYALVFDLQNLIEYH